MGFPMGSSPCAVQLHCLHHLNQTHPVQLDRVFGHLASLESSNCLLTVDTIINWKRVPIDGTTAMEATTALGLTGNITQFVEFGLKLCKTVAEISHSGNGITKSNDDTELLTKNFASSLEVIKGNLSKYCTYLADDTAIAGSTTGQGGGRGGDGGELQAVVDGCKRVALDMLNRLGRLKVGEKTGERKSFVAAIKALWKEKELDELEKKTSSVPS